MILKPHVIKELKEYIHIKDSRLHCPCNECLLAQENNPLGLGCREYLSVITNGYSDMYMSGRAPSCDNLYSTVKDLIFNYQRVTKI